MGVVRIFLVFLLLFSSQAVASCNPKHYLQQLFNSKPASDHLKQLSDFISIKNISPYQTRKLHDTTVYYLLQKEPLKSFPEISKDSKAVLIMMGGSGSEKGSAMAFMRDAASLSPYQVSTITFDYPFTGLGPTHAKFNQANEFKKMVFGIVKHYKKSGKPIYLFGHSYGSTLIKEILHDSPHIASGAILVSPGGNISSGLLEHSQKIIDDGSLLNALKTEGKAYYERGENWSEGPRKDKGVTRQFKSNQILKQPTTAPVLVMSGTQDIYSEPELVSALGQEFKNHRVKFYKGETHTSVFTAKGIQDRKIIEDIIDFIAENNKQKMNRLSSHESACVRAQYYYQNSDLFKLYLKEHRTSISALAKDEHKATNFLANFYEHVKNEIKVEAKKFISKFQPDEINRSEDLKQILKILNMEEKLLGQNEYELMIKKIQKIQKIAD